MRCGLFDRAVPHWSKVLSATATFCVMKERQGICRAVASRLPLPISTEELGHLGESKRYDVTPLIERLGVRPREFADGLAVKLDRVSWFPSP